MVHFTRSYGSLFRYDSGGSKSRGSFGEAAHIWMAVVQKGRWGKCRRKMCLNGAGSQQIRISK